MPIDMFLSSMSKPQLRHGTGHAISLSQSDPKSMYSIPHSFAGSTSSSFSSINFTNCFSLWKTNFLHLREELLTNDCYIFMKKARKGEAMPGEKSSSQYSLLIMHLTQEDRVFTTAVQKINNFRG